MNRARMQPAPQPGLDSGLSVAAWPALAGLSCPLWSGVRMRCAILRKRFIQQLRSLPTRHPWLAWSVLASALIAALIAFPAARNESRLAAHAEFTTYADGIADEIGSRTLVYSDVLYALRGLFAASNDVSRAEFGRFVDGLGIHQRYPGLLNLSYAQRVPHAERAEFERQVRHETGYADFSIKPAGDRPEYHVLLYFAPQEGRRPSFGLDLAHDPLRRGVVERARDSGTVASSEPLALLRHADAKPSSILLRLAVYRDGVTPGQIEERRNAYQGVVGAAIDFKQMMEAVLPRSKAARARLLVYDAGPVTAAQSSSAQRAATPLFDSRDMLPDAAGIRDEAGLERYLVERRLQVGDRLWTLHIVPRADPLPWAAKLIPYLASLVVAMIGISVFGLLRALALAESQATHDKLTGLHNRHYMQEWFDLELHRAQRHQRTIGAIVCDVDHFKRINDSYGHDAGDLVLREAGALIRRFARQSDVVCRHGGEEFVLLLPEASLDSTARRAEQLLQQFRELRLEYRGRPLGPVTISAGVAVFPEHGSNSDALLRHADQALYAAKRQGRDQVVVARTRAEQTPA